MSGDEGMEILLPEEEEEELMIFEEENMNKVLSLKDLIKFRLIESVRTLQGVRLHPNIISICDNFKGAKIEDLKMLYDRFVHKNTPQEINMLILCLLTYHLLKTHKAEEEWHDIYLETFSLLKDAEWFNTLGLAREMILSSLSHVQAEEARFKDKLNQHLFVKKLRKLIGKVNDFEEEVEVKYAEDVEKINVEHEAEELKGDVKLELHFFDIAVKIEMYEQLVEPKCRDDVVRLTKLAEKKGVNVKAFKESVIIFLELWVECGFLDINEFNRLKGIIEENVEKDDLDQFAKKCASEPIEVAVELIKHKENFPGFNCENLKKIDGKYQDRVQIVVWECEIPGFGEKIAVKECRARKEEDLDCFREEAKILNKLSGSSRNFLKFYGDNYYTVVENEETILIYRMAMEYVANTLQKDKQRRDNMKKPYSEGEFISFFKQMLDAFKVLTTQRIMHCDIKPSNLLITDNGIIKVIDFNSAKLIQDRTMLANTVGTPDFMAPELRRAMSDPSKQGEFRQDKTDVYSLGMTLLYLLTDSIKGMNLEENQKKLDELIDSIRFEGFKKFLRDMLAFNPANRKTLSELAEIIPNDPSRTIET
jgi:serine/threonine protein kinase